MFLIRFADLRHGSQTLLMAGIPPRILTVPENLKSSFFYNFFHVVNLRLFSQNGKEMWKKSYWLFVIGGGERKKGLYRE
jgi:hypothetical protein